MFRKMAVVAALLIVTSPRLFALGLGEISMQSALNQPMQAMIDLTSSAGTPLDSIKVSLASLEAHQRAGLTKAPILANFKFAVEQGSAGNAVIRVSSDDPVREPYLEFMLELEWPNGRLLRQYTVLIDPPVTMPATPVVPAAPVTRAATRAVAPAPVRPVQAPAARQASTPRTVPVAPAAADEYGPIRRNETLWSVAERVRPDAGISMHQMMLALLRANPDAFVNGNMNQLKAGTTLKVPARDEIMAFSAREALAETQRQHSEWLAETGQEGAAAAPAAAREAAATGTARLQLVAPEGDAVEGAAMPGDPETAGKPGGSADLTQQLALATEEVEAGKAQSRELQSRVNELEAQVETMQRLLELKDDALANMQNNLAETDDASAAATPDQEAVAATPGADAEQAAAAVEPAPVLATPAARPAELTPGGIVAGIVDRVMANPLLAGGGLGALLLLGVVLWLLKRRREAADDYDDDMSLVSQLSAGEALSKHDWAEPVFDVEDQAAEHADDEEEEDLLTTEASENDPVTEAEVYLAYGRIQQAEDVLKSALQREPGNAEVRLKLLEVHHLAGNTVAFEQAASEFRAGIDEDDPRWIKVAGMGYTMVPDNPLYRAGAAAPEHGSRAATETVGEHSIDISATVDAPAETAADDDGNGIDFDLDLSGMESAAESAGSNALGLELETAGPPVTDQPDTIDFGLDALAEEDGYDGMLANEDEVTTKLDLARAYIDMDDKESARSILGEVMEEGNQAQKQEAEKIFAQIA
ncbi:MAG: FimV/HubP family polar landmark protein [Pseudomonadota bacterium]